MALTPRTANADDLTAILEAGSQNQLEELTDVLAEAIEHSIDDPVTMRTSDPVSTPLGRIWYRSDLDQLRIKLLNGTAFIPFTLIENPLPTAGFSVTAPAPANEGTGGTPVTRYFTVTLTGDRSIQRSVDYALSGGTTNPVSANDIVGGFTSGTLVWAPSDPATKTVGFAAVPDSDYEQNEWLRITLSNAQGAGSTINVASVEASILNDDAPPSSGFAVQNVPVITQDSTTITMTTNATYTGGTVTSRLFDLFRNGVKVGSGITLPYTKTTSDYAQKLRVRETGSDGTTTVYSLSNELTDGNAVTPLHNFTFSEANGTKLRDLGWTPINGGWPGSTTEADKAVVQDGKLVFAQLANATPLSAHTFPVGSGNFEYEWVIESIDGINFRPKYLDENNYLQLDLETNGRFSLIANISGGGASLARWKLPNPPAAGDVLKFSIIDNNARFTHNGVEYNSAPYDVVSTPGNAGTVVGAGANAIIASNRLFLTGWQWSGRSIDRFTINSVSIPLQINSATITATPTQRQIDVAGKYAGSPDAYLLSITRLDGTPIINAVDVTENLNAGDFTISHLVDESILAPHTGRDVLVGVIQKNNQQIVASYVTNLPDLNAPGVVPLVVGLNTCNAESWSENILNRDLARKGNWVYGTINNYANFPNTKLHPTNFFPTDFDGDTSVILKIIEGSEVSNMVQYEVTVPATMTVAFHNVIGFTATAFSGGKSTVTFNSAAPSGVFMALRFSGTIPNGATVTILPKNDANASRKCSDQLRDTISNNGIKLWRPMEALKTNDNSPNAHGMFIAKGAKSGSWNVTAEMAVELNRDFDVTPWWMTHLFATDGYATDVAATMAHPTTGLKMGSKLYNEVGNEPWNWGGGFTCYFHARALGWELGLAFGATAANRSPKPPLVGYTKGMGDQPFDVYTRATTRAFAENDYFMGGIVGEGVGMIFRAKRATTAGAVVPTHAQVSNDDFEMVLNETDSWMLTYRFIAYRSKQIADIFRNAWVSAGRDPNDIITVMNYQAADVNGARPKAVADYVGYTLGAQYSVAIAPYWGTQFTADYTLSDTNYLDRVFMSTITDTYTDASYIQQWKTSLTTAGAPNAVVVIYEVNHHMPNALLDQSGNWNTTPAAARVWAYRQDKRVGMLLKLNMTRTGQLTPGSVYAIFGDATRATWANWGIQNTMGESANPVNPEAKALQEWNASYILKKPTIDIFAENEINEGADLFYVVRTGPAALAQTVQILVEAGAVNPILNGEVTGGINQTINVDFAANELYKAVTVNTNVVADRQMKLSVVANPYYTVGVHSVGGITQVVKNV